MAEFAPTTATSAPIPHTPANMAMSTTISDALTLYSSQRMSLRPSASIRS